MLRQQPAGRGAVLRSATSRSTATAARASTICRLAVLLADAARASTTRRTSTPPIPEQRNNRQLTGSVTDFWKPGGRHETKGGYEWFRSQRTGGNSQSSTSYVFNADFADRRRRHAGARRDGPADPGVRARRLVARLSIRRRAARRSTSTTTSVYAAGSLDDQRPTVGRPRRALRARAGRVDRRHRQRRHQPHRAAAGGRLRRQRQRQPHRPRRPTASTPAATTRRRSAPTARSATPPTSSPSTRAGRPGRQLRARVRTSRTIRSTPPTQR